MLSVLQPLAMERLSCYCSFVQAQAAAQAGVSVIQPNVGRIMDWYKKHPGYIKNLRVTFSMPGCLMRLCHCSRYQVHIS